MLVDIGRVALILAAGVAWFVFMVWSMAVVL